MVSATVVFTPTNVPTFTYVERVSKDYEAELRQAFKIPKMVISISGPSKSGKTTLVTRVVAPENLIHIYGASIKTVDDLWKNVIAWMGGPIARSETIANKVGGEVSGTAGVKGGIPLLAEAKGEGKATVGYDRTSSTTNTFAPVGLDDIVHEIGNSDYVVFVDDFHYIDKQVREEIGKQIKAAAEKGVRVCTASVPHRADDVVRSNTELRGRVTAVDMSYWSADELEQIANKGFVELNMAVEPSVLKQLAKEAFGSPQLMQAICLNFCFARNVNATLPSTTKIETGEAAIRQIFERTSVTADFSSMLKTLHAGPKQRGTERKQFDFVDGTSGDVYRCVLLAMKADPSTLSFRYDEMLKRTREVCKGGEGPVGSSVAQSLQQMADLAKTVQTAPVIEWDENVLDIVEPYFLFFLRCSPLMQSLAHVGGDENRQETLKI